MKRYLIYCMGMRKKGLVAKVSRATVITNTLRHRGEEGLGTYIPPFFAKIQKNITNESHFFRFQPPYFFKTPPSLFSTIRGARHLRFPMLTKRKSLPTFHTASYLCPVQDKASCRILSLERALRHRIGVFYARQGRHGY